MNKISIISSHIAKCEELYNSNDLNEIKNFIEEMISVYCNEIKGFTDNLNSRSIMRGYEKINIEEAIQDLKRIKAMLENHKANIKSGLFQTNQAAGINIKNIASSESVVNVNITTEQVINNINELPDNILSEEEKNELEDKLRALESVINTGNKEKIKSKLEKLIKFSLEKGPAVIALISNAISLFTDKILPLFS